MKIKKIKDKYIIRLNEGEEIVTSIKNVCEKNNIKAGIINGIGAATEVRMGPYDLEKKEHIPTIFKGKYEITSLCGNISTMCEKIHPHIHITIADLDNFKALGGHLIFAIVKATCEIIIEVIDGELIREEDEINHYNILKL